MYTYIIPLELLRTNLQVDFRYIPSQIPTSEKSALFDHFRNKLLPVMVCMMAQEKIATILGGVISLSILILALIFLYDSRGFSLVMWTGHGWWPGIELAVPTLKITSSFEAFLFR